MPSKILSEIRETYPQLSHIPDNEIIVKIGNKYPKALQLDEELASEHEKLTSFTAGGAAYDVYTRGVKGGLLNLGEIASGVVEAGAAELEERPRIFGPGPALIKKMLPDVHAAVSGKVKEWADTAGDFYREKSAEQVAAAEANMPSTVERFAGKLTHLATTTIAPLAAGPVGGFPAVIAASGLTTFGSTYRSAKESYEKSLGKDDPDIHRTSMRIAAVDGLKTAAITALGGVIASKSGSIDIDKLTSGAKTPAFRAGLKEFLKKLGIGVTIESLEEGIDEGLSAALAQHSYNPDADITEAFAEAAFYTIFLAGAGGAIKHGVELRNIRKLSRKLEEAGMPAAAQKVLEKKIQEIQEEDARSEKPDEKLEENLKDTPTGGTKPVAQLPDAPQSQLDAMPESDEITKEVISGALGIDVDEISDVDDSPVTKADPVPPAQVEESEIEYGKPLASADGQVQTRMPTPVEPEPDKVQAEVFPGDTLTDDEVEDLARDRVLSDLGLENIDPEVFAPVSGLHSVQLEIYEEAYKANKGFYEQYRGQPEKYRAATSESVEVFQENRKEQDEKAAREKAAASQSPAHQAPAHFSKLTFTAENIPNEHQGEYNKLLEALAGKKSKLRGKWRNMKSKVEGESVFKWYQGAGSSNLSNPVKRSRYPSKYGLTERRLLVEEFKTQVRALADKLSVEESELIDLLLAEGVKYVESYSKGTKRPNAIKNINEAAEEQATPSLDVQGSDTLEEVFDQEGKIPVPVMANGKIGLSPKNTTGETDGSEKFIDVSAAWFKKFPGAAGRKLKKVPEAEFAKWGPDSVMQGLAAFNRRWEDASTGDLWDELASGVERRLDNVGKKSETKRQEEAFEEFVKQQIKADEEAKAEGDAYDAAERLAIKQADTSKQASETPLSDDVPFASLPPNLVNGVQIDAGRDSEAQAWMDRVEELLPGIQKKLGGAKVTRIRIDETAEAPAYSAVRSGNFGTVFLNPRWLSEMHATGQLDLSRVITEEIIHNYNGLALYRDWKKSGSPGTWQSYYERKMTDIFEEMNASEIRDTVYYYSGGEPESLQGRAFANDPVNIAEEFLRILLQRKLTKGINEDLFQKVKDRSALRKVIQALRRFWNGLTRGFMRRSSAVRRLNARTRFLMQDKGNDFPSIDREIIHSLTRASQGFFKFDQPNVEAQKIEKDDATPKPENGFNDNEGTYLGSLFNSVRLEGLKNPADKNPDMTAQRIKELRAQGNLDFSQELFALDHMSIEGELSRKETESSKEFIDSNIARYIQRQTPEPLPDVALELFYLETKKVIKGIRWLQESDKDLAFWYVYSRVLNDARKFLLEHRNPRESDTQILGGKPSPGRPAFSANLTIYNKAKDFRIRRRNSIGRAAGTDEEGNPLGLVSLDEKLAAVSGEGYTRLEAIKVANPFEVDPRQKVVVEGVAKALDKIVPYLGGRERDLLFYGIDDEFATGWQKRFAKSRGISKGRASQLWSEVQAKVITQLSGTLLSPRDKQLLQEAAEKLPADVRENVEQAIHVKEQISVKQAIADTQKQMLDRNVAAIAQLLNEEPAGIVSAAIPPALNAAATKALSYRGKASNTAPVVDNDARPQAVKDRMKSAESVNEETFIELYKKYIQKLKDLKDWKRQFRHLDPSRYGEVIEVLRQFKANPETSRARAANAIRAIMSGLNAKQRDKFKRIIALRDLKRSINEGLYPTASLPFGFRTTIEVERALAQDELDLLTPENRPILEAVNRRKAIYDLLLAEMQERKMLPKNIATGDEYFHRITLEYIADGSKYEGDAALDLRTGRAGFQKKRRGSDKDYSTNYFFSEFEVLSQVFSQLETHQTLGNLKGLLDKRPAFVRDANRHNISALVEQGHDPAKFFYDETKKIAIAVSSLRKLIRDGNLSFDPRYSDVAESLEQEQSHPDFFAFLKHLSSTNSGGQMYANMIFKAVKAKEANLKEAIGDNYKTWRNIVKDRGEYEVWQPVEGNFLYRSSVATDQALIKWFENANPSDQKTIAASDLANALVLGGKREEWVIPKEAAKQLNELRPGKYVSGDDLASKALRAHQKLLAQWKYWKLFNPWGLVNYEINNMTGDADIVFAYDPTIISTYARAAYDDLVRYHVQRAPISDRGIEDLMRKGVIGSGWQMQDLAEMNEELAYQALFGDILDATRKKSGWLKKVSNGYTRKVAVLNQIREDVLRVAAYRHFLAELKSGLSPVGVSNRVELDQIPSLPDKAAKLSRELLGDYGALSQAGQFIRANIIPFWSWMELNAPRYVRLMRNAIAEGQGGGRVAGVVAKRGAVKATKGVVATALLAQTLPLFINLWNELFIALGAVDEEDKKVIDARNQQHLLLYSSEDGRVISIRMQGALTDALEWFGLGSMYSSAFDVLNDRLNLADAAEDYFATGEYWKGAAQRLSSGANPFVKLPIEVLTKLKWYPDLANQSPIHDRLEHVLNTATIGWKSQIAALSYNLYKEFPRRGALGGGNLLDDMINVVTYSTDTGEAAFNYIKAKEYHFMREIDGDTPAFQTTDKSDALYYYNKARSYGDKGAAERWKKEYIALGGKVSGMKRSERGRAPLARVKKQHRREFLRSLTEVERSLLERAKQWHQDRIR